ncbi:MAG: sugar transferase [Eubacteriales bacterium]|nr:sugar transferase [Eubacteriales bacterium]
MRDKRFYSTQLMKLAFQSFLYFFLFISFFGLLSINNPQLLNLSRTAATTMATFAACMLILSIVYGGFDIGVKKMRSVFASLTLTTFFTDIVSYLYLQIMNVNPQNPDANKTLILWGEDFYLLLAAYVLQTLLIFLFVSLAYRSYFRINPPKRCLIVTSSQELAKHIALKMNTFPQRYQLCEVVHYECSDIMETILEYDAIFIAGIPDTEEAVLKSFCYQYNKTIYLMAELEDVIISTAESCILDDMPFLCIHRIEPTLIQHLVKRGCDIVISVLGILITSPVMLITALILKLSHNGSVLFHQKRATINGDVFEILKFRTMYEAARDEVEVSASIDDSRITPVGRFLRKYRFDELPQLFNVLHGEMSIVGPRPEMLENVERYTREVPEFRYRQQMKAGLTGLAQIEGKYNTSPKDKAILDLLYIENFSLAYDFKLMLRTLTIFFRRDSAEGFVDRQCACPKMRVVARNVQECKKRGLHTSGEKSSEAPPTAQKDDSPLRAAL